MDELGLVEAVDGLGEGVVIAVAPGAHGVHDARVSEALGVADGQVLDAAVRVMDQSREVPVAPAPDGHLEGVESEVGAHG